MRVWIAGIDGYLGWSLAKYLGINGYDVGGMDNYSRREQVAEIGSQSATPIVRMTDRIAAYNEHFGRPIQFIKGDLTNYNAMKNALLAFGPDCIVHLGEMPSAPYSMIDADHCSWTHRNNLLGTLNMIHVIRDYMPDCHLLKLGTMGEYGTPNVRIGEGWLNVEIDGRADRLPYPKQAGSWYHQTKVHDSNNVMMACRLWGLRSTDIMQGVVYGIDFSGAAKILDQFLLHETQDDDRMLTRFDFDECFGTAINRFCAQAVIGLPITLYGAGHQKRGFLPLEDSMQCMKLLIDNPSDPGEYRVANQLEEVYLLEDLADIVADEAEAVIGSRPEVLRYENPRRELEEHFYDVDRKILVDLGYRSTLKIREGINMLLVYLSEHAGRIKARSHAIVPSIRWSGKRERVGPKS